MFLSVVVLYKSTGGQFNGVGLVSVSGVESCKIVLLREGISYSPVQTLLQQDVSFSPNTLRHRRTDRQTDSRQTVAYAKQLT